jgi:hypothetical protein
MEVQSFITGEPLYVNWTFVIAPTISSHLTNGTANSVKAHSSFSQPLCMAMCKKSLDKKEERYENITTLACILITLPQTWQLVAKSIKVIDRSNETVEPRYQAVLPTAEKRGATSSTALTDFKIEKKIRTK